MTDSHCAIAKKIDDIQPKEDEKKKRGQKRKSDVLTESEDESQLSCLFLRKAPLYEPPNKKSKLIHHGIDIWHFVKNLESKLREASTKKKKP